MSDRDKPPEYNAMERWAALRQRRERLGLPVGRIGPKKRAADLQPGDRFFVEVVGLPLSREAQTVAVANGHVVIVSMSDTRHAFEADDEVTMVA